MDTRDGLRVRGGRLSVALGRLNGYITDEYTQRDPRHIRELREKHGEWCKTLNELMTKEVEDLSTLSSSMLELEDAVYAKLRELGLPR